MTRLRTRSRDGNPTVLAGSVLACVATLVLASAGPAVSGPTIATAPTYDIGPTAVGGRLDPGLQAMLRQVTDAGVPGALVRVQTGSEVRQATAGVADVATGAALRPGDRFRAGSVTKTFVATVVLQLAQERRLSLDEPVARYLPGLLAGGNGISVRQLLNHTSGLPDYTQDPTVLAGIVEDRVFAPRELVAIAESHPGQAPGAGFAYSNTNYVVAGLLVEAVTGHRLDRALRRRIIEPLGLRHTSFPDAGTPVHPDQARGYVPADLVPTPDGRPYDVTARNPSAAWAAGAIVSTAPDLARFFRALMTHRLLDPSLLREMQTTVPQDPSDPTQFRYGLGLERVQDACGASWGHSGTTFGYQTMAYWNDQSGRTVVVASTMFPASPAAEAALVRLAEVALCG